VIGALVRLWVVAVLVAMSAPSAVAQEPGGERARPRQTYRVLFDARIVPSERVAHVRIQVTDANNRLRGIDFRIDPERHTRFEGDGTVTIDGERVSWVPPRQGGELRYRFHINHLRDERSYDARATRTYVLFRGGDMVPPAKVRTTPGAESVSRLRIRLPEGWSAATPFARLTTGDYRVNNVRRRFDRPVGWIVAGDLGVVREDVGRMRIAIAAPAKHGMRRHDTLALLRWTAEPLADLFRQLPDRFLIVGAGDPMWRGGLSGPNSVYLHATRPLITEDGTSPLLHEVLHTLLGLRAQEETDWLVEGLAEYYSIALLGRSGTFSDSRYAQVLETQRRRGGSESASGRLGASFGVAFLLDLDEQLRSETDGEKSLDDVVRVLEALRPELTRELFERVVSEATGVDVSDAWPE